jgi:hypothetical protein
LDIITSFTRAGGAAQRVFSLINYFFLDEASRTLDAESAGNIKNSILNYLLMVIYEKEKFKNH